MTTTLFGYLMLSRGLGNVLCTPIATALRGMSSAPNLMVKTGFEVGGGEFEKMIVYVGSCFALASVLAGVGWAIDRKH